MSFHWRGSLEQPPLPPLHDKTRFGFYVPLRRSVISDIPRGGNRTFENSRIPSPFPRRWCRDRPDGKPTGVICIDPDPLGAFTPIDAGSPIMRLREQAHQLLSPTVRAAYLFVCLPVFVLSVGAGVKGKSDMLRTFSPGVWYGIFSAYLGQ